MIPRLRRRLIEYVCRRLAQDGPLAAETHVADPAHVLVAVGEVVLEEEHDAVHFAKERALDGDLLHVRRLRELKRLDGVGLLRGGEVEVVAVDEDLERPGGGWRGRCAEEDGM